MKVKIRSIIVACASAVMCVSLLLGGAYALFSKEIEINNHLVAGKLDIGLNRVLYTENSLNEFGLLETTADDTIVNLLEDSTPIFEISNAVPTCFYAAKIEISNLGDVAFDYGIRFLIDESYAESELGKQLEITVSLDSDEEVTYQFMLDEAIGATDLFDLGYILTGEEAQLFTICVEFVDDEDNNLAQGDEIAFDIQVVAVQKVSE